jgi:hypothetical protein
MSIFTIVVRESILNLLSHSLISVYIYIYIYISAFAFYILCRFVILLEPPLRATQPFHFPCLYVQCEDVTSIYFPWLTIFSDTVQGQYPMAFSLMLNLWMAEQGGSSFPPPPESAYFLIILSSSSHCFLPNGRLLSTHCQRSQESYLPIFLTQSNHCDHKLSWISTTVWLKTRPTYIVPRDQQHVPAYWCCQSLTG